MRVIFVNRFYFPDISATSQMLTSLSTGVAENFEVQVLTSRNLYDDPNKTLDPHERYCGVAITRLTTTRFGRARSWGRALDYASFFAGVALFLLLHTRRGDCVILMTDPPLLSLFNTTIVRLKGGQVINWIQDIFPEIAVKLGAMRAGKLATRLLVQWRNQTLRSSRVNVVISEAMRQVLLKEGVDNVETISNWAHQECIHPVKHEDNPLFANWNPMRKFTVGYSGNFGRAHSFSELIQAMAVLKDEQNVQFLLIGEGAAAGALRRAVAANGYSNVLFKPYQAPKDLANSLGALDLHLVTLKPDLEGLIMPSKLYAALAAARPVAFVGNETGEIAQLVLRQDVGFVVGHGDGLGLAEQIRALASDPERLVRYKTNAWTTYDRQFSLNHALESWRGVMCGADLGAVQTGQP